MKNNKTDKKQFHSDSSDIFSIPGEKNPQLAAIDDLVRWGLRMPYWQSLLGHSDTMQRQSLLEYVSSRWRQINGHNSPRGQIPVSSIGAMDSKTKAAHLATAYNAVIFAAYGRIEKNQIPPIDDYLVLHLGYKLYKNTLRGSINKEVGVERVYRAVLDAHEYFKCKEKSMKWAGGIPVRCANNQCSLHGLYYIFSMKKTTTYRCPLCGHAPDFDD